MGVTALTDRVLTKIGVGPWEGQWPAEPELSLYDESLLAGGDRRNVVDKYRYWRHEAIVRDLDAQRHDFHVAVENWGHDFNIGSVIRTANAFNAKAFHIVGKRRWNRRGAMVTDRYQHEYHHPTVEDLVHWADLAAAGTGTGALAARGAQVPVQAGRARMPIIGIDNLPGSQPIETYQLPRHCILLFGQEGPGLSAQAREASLAVLDIAQFGSTRSINAGAAAAIAMHAWVRRHVFDQPPGS
jgi:tRNA(Leu) C34 or U34 (ribose-2'-O)-methylase TrmL